MGMQGLAVLPLHMCTHLQMRTICMDFNAGGCAGGAACSHAEQAQLAHHVQILLADGVEQPRQSQHGVAFLAI